MKNHSNAPPSGNRPKIALGKRLRECPSFRCIGVRPNWTDYPHEAKEAVLSADRIYYPSRLYREIFLCLGKEIFPRNYYTLIGNKIAQTNLFQLLGIPHPRTRIYYGRDGGPAPKILSEFSYPFVAKVPAGSSRGEGVFLITGEDELSAYLSAHNPAYVQEYLLIARDLRVVLIAGQIVNAYWRIQKPGDFRNNVTQGAEISFEGVPEEALEFAKRTAARCGFDEAALDICLYGGKYYVLEANMAYGMEGFVRKGLDIGRILARLDSEGFI